MIKVGPINFIDCGEDLKDEDLIKIKKATADHPEKRKLVFMPFTDIVQFKIEDDVKRGYKVRYKLPNGERIDSTQVYTKAEIDKIFFIMIPKRVYGQSQEMARGLSQLVPDGLSFAFVQDEIEISIIDNK